MYSAQNQKHAMLPRGGDTAISMEDAQKQFADVQNNLVGDDKDWSPTIVNPSKTGGILERGLFLFHLLVWVTALGLSITVNFAGPGDFMKNSTNASYIPCAAGELGGAQGCTNDPAVASGMYGGSSDATSMLGVLGGVSILLGVLTLVLSACFVKTDEFKDENYGMFINVIIQFLTLFGTTTTLYMFSRAASEPTSKFYPIALTGVIFTVYAQVLLYCCSAALGVKALPRAFIPSLATAVQIVSAVAINSGDFAPTASNGQKMVATLVPLFTGLAVFLMFGLRMFTRPGGLLSKYDKGGNLKGGAINTRLQARGISRGIDELDVSKIDERPFLRSLFLTPYMAGGILSVYKLSFVKLDTDPTSYVFAFFGMLLNFAIIGVVFQPAADLAKTVTNNGDPATDQ